jgi:hypothetical protein
VAICSRFQEMERTLFPGRAEDVTSLPPPLYRKERRFRRKRSPSADTHPATLPVPSAQQAKALNGRFNLRDRSHRASIHHHLCGSKPGTAKPGWFSGLIFLGMKARLWQMSAAEPTAEVFVTAFKSLNRRQREAVLERMLADAELSEDLADTVALEARRHEPRHSFRQTLKEPK